MDRLQAEMPASLFREWIEYEVLEPFGQWRDNLHSAVIACVIANGNRDPQKNPTPYSPADFYYLDSETHREQSEAAMLETLRAKSKTKKQAAARAARRRKK